MELCPGDVFINKAFVLRLFNGRELFESHLLMSLMHLFIVFMLLIGSGKLQYSCKSSAYE